MKKKQSANVIMVAVILMIILTGVLAVGFIQGWFDADDGTQAILTEIRGVINLERDGVTLTVQEDTLLRAGDKITNYPGATAAVRVGDTRIVIGQSAELVIAEPDVEAFAATAASGEYFIHAGQCVKLDMDGRTVEFADSVSQLSVRSGAQSISVFSGTVASAHAGVRLEWIGGVETLSELDIHSLNDFTITQLRMVNESQTLYFSNEDLDELQAQRLAEQQALLNPPVTTAPTEPYETTAPTEETTESTEIPTEEPVEETKPRETEPATEPETVPSTTEQTEPPSTEATVPPTEPTESVHKCTISICCDTILDNMDQLDPAKAGYVPADGVILYPVEVEFAEEETVFDVLNRVCAAYGIQLEYSWTPMYDSYYIEGINNLYEFDCGSESGWMYKVNGWFPNYGCSSYTLSDGDTIVWCYTCVGLGADVGA